MIIFKIAYSWNIYTYVLTCLLTRMQALNWLFCTNQIQLNHVVRKAFYSIQIHFYLLLFQFYKCRYRIYVKFWLTFQNGALLKTRFLIEFRSRKNSTLVACVCVDVDQFTDCMGHEQIVGSIVILCSNH